MTVTQIYIIITKTLIRIRTPNLHCFKAGDARVNEQPGLATLHTLWLRSDQIIIIVTICSSCWSPGNTTEWLYKWDRSTPNGPTIGFFLRPGDLSERWVFVFLLFHNVGIDSSKFGLHSLKRSFFVSFWAPPSSGDATHNLQWMAPNHPRSEGSWNIWAEPFTEGFLPGETGI